MNERFDLKNPQHLVALFLVVFILLTIPLTVISVLTNRDQRSQAAGTATLYLQPSTQNVIVDSALVVNIRENSGTVSVSTVDVTLTYDPNRFQYQSIDSETTSDFKSKPVDPYIDQVNGRITINRFVTQALSTPTGVTGDRLIATVRFVAKRVAGASSMGFTTDSYVYRLSDGGDETGARNGATYTVVDPTPSVNITTPTNGAFVKGPVNISADATDNIGVTRVEFYDGAGLIGTDTTATGNSYSVSWNTSGVAAGGHTLTAKAYDLNGSAVSTPINVVVDNTPPTGITLSGLAAKVKGAVTVTATVTETNMDRFEFKVDSGSVTVDNTSPYTYNIDTTLLSNGAHTLTATAIDKSSNSTPATQNFTVDNQGPSAPVLSGTTVSETQINLSWTASTDALSGPVSYDVYRNGTKITSSPITVTSFQVTGLTAATTYTFIVKAIDTMSNSTDSNTLAIATKTPPKFADLNGDNLVNANDLAILIANWGSTTFLQADLSNDGRVGSADLAMLISRWGS